MWLLLIWEINFEKVPFKCRQRYKILLSLHTRTTFVSFFQVISFAGPSTKQKDAEKLALVSLDLSFNFIIFNLSVTNQWRQEQLFVSVPKYALVFQADRGPDRSGNIIVDDIQVSAGPCSGTVPPIIGGGCKYYWHPIGERGIIRNIRFFGRKRKINGFFISNKIRCMSFIPPYVQVYPLPPPPSPIRSDILWQDLELKGTPHHRT